MKLAGALVAVALLLASSRAQTPAAGPELFARRCGGCHALDRDKEGPRLGGVVGRTAASINSFQYSDALKKSGITWDAEKLDQWLAGPEKLVPDNDMTFHVEKAEERRAIIDYLKQNSPH